LYRVSDRLSPNMIYRKYSYNRLKMTQKIKYINISILQELNAYGLYTQ
jgi:hypothetical protein